MDIKACLELAGENLLHGLCPEENYLPYWHMVVWPDRSAEYQFRPYCDGHNVGRWWNAMLRLEECTGFAIPSAVEKAMLENTWRLADNPSGIFLQDTDPANPRTWYIHSYRETMLAFGLLVRYRASEAAQKHGMRAVEQMGKASQDLTQWDLFYCGMTSGNGKIGGGRGEPAYTHGRAIEGILCFYQATGQPEALEEAERLAAFHFEHTVRSDGSLADGAGHHTHSYLNTIRGLILLASMNNQKDLLQMLYSTYEKAILPMITRSGFVTHDIGALGGGDIASAGDIAHIALILWDHYKNPQLLDDAERIVRARLVPSQVGEPMPVKPRIEAQRDCYRALPERFVGAIGGAVGHVQGQTCVTDFTASALHNLIELYNRSVDIGDGFIRVNFHFDWARSGVRVKSVRSGSGAQLTVEDESGREILLRVPGWVDRATLVVRVNDEAAEIGIEDGFTKIPAGGGPTKVELHFALPEYETSEIWRDEFATQETATFKWRGDEIYEVDPVGPYPALFPKQTYA
jgi:hypothetical protein